MVFTGVCLITSDVLRLANFYSRLFDAPVTGNEVHAEVGACGLDLAFFQINSMEEMCPGATLSLGPGNFTLSFRVDDIETEYARVQSMEIELIKPLQTHPWGARSFWFRDADGNLLSFHSPVRS